MDRETCLFLMIIIVSVMMVNLLMLGMVAMVRVSGIGDSGQ